MEIDVTKIVEMTSENPTRFSASCAETGQQNIGQLTWKRAVHAAIDEEFTMSDAELAAWVAALAEFGAWSKEEIEEWTREESIALFIQFVSGDFRQLESLLDDIGESDPWMCSEEQFSKATENFAGHLYPCEDAENRKFYYHVGL